MAKELTTSVTIDFRLASNETRGTVRIRIRWWGKRKAYALRKIKMTKAEFEKIKNNQSKLSPDLYDLKMKIVAQKVRAQQIIENLGDGFTFETFEELFYGIKKMRSRQMKFSDLVNEYIDQKDLEIQTKRGYLTMLNRVKEIKENLTIGELSSRFISDFRGHLKDSVSSSTISIYFRYIKAIWNFALANNLVSLENDPFKGITLPSVQQRKRALNEFQIRSIKEYTSIDKSKQEAIDFFLMSFYCSGMNFKDLLSLKKKNIVGNYIEFQRAKTKNSISKNQRIIKIGLSESLKKLIKKWGLENIEDDEYIFPVLNKEMNPVQKQRKIEQFIQKTNKRLKSIGEELELPLILTTYAARHSFASLVSKKISNPFQLRQLLGHSSTKQTETYISSLDTSTEDEAAIILHTI